MPNVFMPDVLMPNGVKYSLTETIYYPSIPSLLSLDSGQLNNCSGRKMADGCQCVIGNLTVTIFYTVLITLARNFFCELYFL